MTELQQQDHKKYGHKTEIKDKVTSSPRISHLCMICTVYHWKLISPNSTDPFLTMAQESMFYWLQTVAEPKEFWESSAEIARKCFQPKCCSLGSVQHSDDYLRVRQCFTLLRKHVWELCQVHPGIPEQSLLSHFWLPFFFHFRCHINIIVLVFYFIFFFFIRATPWFKLPQGCHCWQSPLPFLVCPAPPTYVIHLLHRDHRP
jgi:hypothetical protein